MFRFQKKNDLDSSQYGLFKKVFCVKWHNQHEDIVNTIYLENLVDDRFVKPIIEIALNKEIFRPYDDKIKSILRKCVHTLKTIDT